MTTPLSPHPARLRVSLVASYSTPKTLPIPLQYTTQTCIIILTFLVTPPLQIFLTACTNISSTAGIPRLQITDLEALNVPITEEEIESTIKSLPSHKSRSPDGLPYKYYKTFLPLLLPHMCKLFNAFFRDIPIPADMQRSFITLIPKPDKDPALCANYRPIALLNSDFKFFTKLLSIRLNVVLPSLIHKDQVGFVPLRQAGDSTKKVIDLVDVANRENSASLLLSLDAEKAFGHLGWPFLVATLQHVGFEGPFFRAIQHLYSHPTSQVRTPFAPPSPHPL